jgi:uncharacterized protein (DUF58 family)
MLFHDVESGRDHYIDPATARAEYQRKMAAHSEGVEAICNKLGFAFYRILTNQPLDLALLDFLRSRGRRGKQIRRRAQAGMMS